MGDRADSLTSEALTKLLPGRLEAPDVQMHRSPPHSNAFVVDPPNTIVELSPDYHLVPSIAVSPIATPIMGQHTAPGPYPPLDPSAMPASILEGAKGSTLNNPVFNNIGGNATIFKSDGGQSRC
jgi:hypothetical protein